MKKKVVLVVLIICVCVLFFLHNRYSAYENIEHKILFVYQYTNWAEGYMNYGYYIDKDGNKVEFDLSSQDEKYANIQNLVDYLENRNIQKSTKVFSVEEMQQYYKWLCKINKYSFMKEKSVAQDYGQVVLYGIRYREWTDLPEIINIHEQGDWIRVNTDEYAEKLSDVDELIEKWDLEHFGYSKEEKRFIEE